MLKTKETIKVKYNKSKTAVVMFGKWGKEWTVAGIYWIESGKFNLYKKIKRKTLRSLYLYKKEISELLNQEIQLIIPGVYVTKRWKSYRDYLLSDEWRRKRKKKLKSADNRCQICYSDKELNVHHRTYLRIFNEKQSDLTVLCRDCHETFHSKFQDEKDNELILAENQ